MSQIDISLRSGTFEIKLNFKGDKSHGLDNFVTTLFYFTCDIRARNRVSVDDKEARDS